MSLSEGRQGRLQQNTAGCGGQDGETEGEREGCSCFRETEPFGWFSKVC